MDSEEALGVVAGARAGATAQVGATVGRLLAAAGAKLHSGLEATYGGEPALEGVTAVWKVRATIAILWRRAIGRDKLLLEFNGRKSV